MKYTIKRAIQILKESGYMVRKKAVQEWKKGPGRPVEQACKCSIIGCKGEARVKNFCAGHYQSYRTHGHVNGYKPYAAPQSQELVELQRGRRPSTHL